MKNPENNRRNQSAIQRFLSGFFAALSRTFHLYRQECNPVPGTCKGTHCWGFKFRAEIGLQIPAAAWGKQRRHRRACAAERPRCGTDHRAGRTACAAKGARSLPIRRRRAGAIAELRRNADESTPPGCLHPTPARRCWHLLEFDAGPAAFAPARPAAERSAERRGGRAAAKSARHRGRAGTVRHKTRWPVARRECARVAGRVAGCVASCLAAWCSGAGLVVALRCILIMGLR